MKNIFSTYHPAVNLAFFLTALVLAMVSLQPVLISISIIAGSVYSIYLSGWRRFLSALWFRLLIFGIVMIVNPLVNHRGLTVLFEIWENPITLEALLNGMASGGMLVSIFIWFDCFNILVTNEKFLYLFGRILPGTALLLSMTLKMIPEAKIKARSVENGQIGLYGGGQDNRRELIRSKLNVISVLMGWMLEDGIITADSMNARGYGAARRTSYYGYRWRFADSAFLLTLALLLAELIVNGIFASFSFYPYLELSLSLDSCVGYAVYAILLALPLILDGLDHMLWKK